MTFKVVSISMMNQNHRYCICDHLPEILVGDRVIYRKVLD